MASDSHPLAARLGERLRPIGESGKVLEIATGSGRNARALREMGFDVVPLDDSAPYTQLPGPNNFYIGAISTHGYLHGNLAKLRAGFAELKRVLRTGAPIAITLGSIDDARYGFGIQIDEVTFAPGEGPEVGVPHAFLDRDSVLELLGGFGIDRLEEVDVDEIVGRWAHDEDDPGGRRHWFVEAHKE